MFSVSSPCLLGQHGSCSTDQQPMELLENIVQNLIYKLPPQIVLHYMNNRYHNARKLFNQAKKDVFATYAAWPWMHMSSHAYLNSFHSIVCQGRRQWWSRHWPAALSLFATTSLTGHGKPIGCRQRAARRPLSLFHLVHPRIWMVKETFDMFIMWGEKGSPFSCSYVHVGCTY